MIDGIGVSPRRLEVGKAYRHFLFRITEKYVSLVIGNIEYNSIIVTLIITMYYKRDISKRLLALAGAYPALILTGARQTGKTTLLKELFPDHKYLSLDLPSDAEMAENDPERFFSEIGDEQVIIDEAQYAPKMFRYLKIAIDSNRRKYGRFILTGSQKFNLMKEVSDSLAGRCVWLELEGLSSHEISQQHSNYLELDFIHKLMVRGSQPELWERLDLEPSDYYRTYLATYLERDVRQIVNVSSLRDFERFIRLLATRNGQILNMSAIAKDVGSTTNTIKQWISVLESSNQIHLLEPYFSNTGKRVIKSPKVYFSDVGMLCYLLGLNQDGLKNSAFIGQIWESYVCSEFRKAIKNYLDHATLWFYRDQRQREIDLILSRSNKLEFFEIKWQSGLPSPSELGPMNAVYSDMQANSQGLISLGKKAVLSRIKKPTSLQDLRIENLSFFGHFADEPDSEI